MFVNHPDHVHQGIYAALHEPGFTDPKLRQSVETQAAIFRGAVREPVGVPAELADYIEKIALCAHSITDEDVEQVKNAGYSEEEILELTVTAALGANLARMESMLDALLDEGASDLLD